MGLYVEVPTDPPAQLFYILNPQVSGQRWGYMTPSAPADWLIAQTERVRDWGIERDRD